MLRSKRGEKSVTPELLGSAPGKVWVTIRLPRGEWFYDPTHPLGPAGGFGEVFEGKDASGRSLAIKRLKLAVGEAAHRELKIADELAGRTFKHVLEVFDAGEDSENGGYYVVMPRAERSLSDHIGLRGSPTAAEATEFLKQIAEGLKEVEQIVHRDLKPANILLHGGQWKIADFGIARFVEDAPSANTVRGFLSAPYAAPEQWLGEHATHATDVYALSCIAYFLLTGALPFAGPAKADYQRQHTIESPAPLIDVDPRLRAIFSAGLRKPQAGRPSIDRIINVLREALANPSAQTPGLAALHKINAAEAERVSAAKAQAERERQENAERHALVQSGEAAFREIVAGLRKLAQENAPEARIESDYAIGLTIAMGQAEMQIHSEGAVPTNVFLGSAKVLAIGSIRVSQKNPQWSHGATLWYMRSQAVADCRWYEVAYKKNAIASGPIIGPFPIQDVENDIYRHANLAAGPGMHVIQVDFGPTPIDDEDSESFFERWLAHLAEAYGGRLRPF